MSAPTRLWSGTEILGQTTTPGHALCVHHCGGCGLVFAIDDDFDEALRENHKSFYCPKCQCGYSYGHESKLEAERRLREAAERRERATRDLLAHEQQAHQGTKISRGRAKAERDRLKKRASAGVCPCCNRTFQQLARHMKSKHPDFAEKAAKP